MVGISLHLSRGEIEIGVSLCKKDGQTRYYCAVPMDSGTGLTLVEDGTHSATMLPGVLA